MAIPTVGEAQRYRKTGQKERLTDRQEALVTSVLTSPDLTPAEHVASAGYLAPASQILKQNAHLIDKAFDRAGITRKMCVRMYKKCLNAKRVMVRTDKKGVVHVTKVGPDYPIILKTLEKIAQLRNWDPGLKIQHDKTTTNLIGIEEDTLERLRQRKIELNERRVVVDADCSDQATN